MSDRLPCPCGRKNLRKLVMADHHEILWKYRCPACGRETGWMKTEAKMRKAWNELILSEREEKS